MKRSKHVWIVLTSSIVLICLMNDIQAQFQKHIPLFGLQIGHPKSISQDYTGNYYVSGFGLYQFEYDPFLIKTDKGGKVLWLRHYEVTGGLPEHGGFLDAKTIDNDPEDVAAVGYQIIPNVNKERMFVSKIDGKNGVPKKNIAIFPSPLEGNGTATKVVTSDDVIAVFGNIRRLNEDYKIGISMFDPNLNQINSALYFFNGNTSQILLDAVKTDDGYLIVGGNNLAQPYYYISHPYSHELFILKVDNNLNVQWNKIIKVKNQYIRGNSVTAAIKKDEVYIVGDFQDTFSSGSIATPFLLRMKMNGSINWIKYYQGPNVLGGRFNSVVFNDDISEINIATDLNHVHNGNLITISAGFVSVNTQGDVQKTGYFEYAPAPNSSLTYAYEIIKNNNNGFSSVATLNYINPNPSNPIPGFGAVLVESLKDGTSQDACVIPIELRGYEMEFSVSNLKYKGSLPLKVERFTYQTLKEKAFSFDCNEDFVSTTSNTKTKLFPNPSSESFSVRGSIQIERIMVYDKTTVQIKIEDYKPEEKIDIEPLEAGFYYVEILYTNGQKEVLTLVKN